MVKSWTVPTTGLTRGVNFTLLLLTLVVSITTSQASEFTDTWRGVDLSYVNELEACGAKYADSRGNTDPYEIFAEAGANWVRLRLWHTPAWTDYSTLDDVKRSIARARAHGMNVLLDFHYSDDWVHPGKQLVPAAWRDVVDDTQALAEKLADYTYQTLMELDKEGLLPDAVQVGNETNTDLAITERLPRTRR